MDHELKIDFRRQRILELLAQEGQVKVTRLSELFHTTPVTIRSDLAALEKDGYLKRVTGGAVQTVRNFYTMDAQQRKSYNLEAKTAIAKTAADLIKDGDTLLINSGTTTLLIATELKKRNSLNIVTNSMAAAGTPARGPEYRPSRIPVSTSQIRSSSPSSFRARNAWREDSTAAICLRQESTASLT